MSTMGFSAPPGPPPLSGATPPAEERPFVRWYRDTRHRWLFGVCAGLSYHTRIPVEMWRLAFVISAFFVWGIAIYLALAIIMPRRA